MKNYDSPEERDRAFQKKMRETHQKMMKEYGWYAHYVADDTDSPTKFNAHTHGFEESWNHPDIQIVVPMEGPRAHSLFWMMVDLIKEGKKYEPGKKYDDVLEGYPVMFAWASEGNRRLLRMILPDKEGGVARDEIKAPYSKQWQGTEE